MYYQYSLSEKLLRDFSRNKKKDFQKLEQFFYKGSELYRQEGVFLLNRTSGSPVNLTSLPSLYTSLHLPTTAQRREHLHYISAPQKQGVIISNLDLFFF